jgi:hypothetical protein
VPRKSRLTERDWKLRILVLSLNSSSHCPINVASSTGRCNVLPNNRTRSNGDCFSRECSRRTRKYHQRPDIAIVSRARSVKICLAGDPAATISSAPQENVFPQTESGGPIGVAALAIGCAIPPKAAISIQAQCLGHSGTCRALTCGFLTSSPRPLTQPRLASVRLLK